MENEQFDSPTGMRLDLPPLIYLHEHFKAYNKKSSTPLKNNWVWYSKEDLKAILKLIEEIKDDDPNKEGDGVRLYYGIYNDKVCEYLTRINKGNDYSNHKDHNTVFFVPTYKIEGEGEHIDDITPESVIKYQDDYNHNRDLPKFFEGGYNVGNICPPPRTVGGDCSSSGSQL